MTEDINKILGRIEKHLQALVNFQAIRITEEKRNRGGYKKADPLDEAASMSKEVVDFVEWAYKERLKK